MNLTTRISSLFVLLLLAPAAWALQPDQLLLITNHNVPESVQLAEYYAQARGVPAHRIIELDLPAGEHISFEDYERKVVPPIRDFLRFHDPRRQIKCLVTFYGVPIHIEAHKPTDQEVAESKELTDELAALEKDLQGQVETIEAAAKEYDPQFVPLQTRLREGAPRGAVLDLLFQRCQKAGKSIANYVEHLPDPQQRHNGEMRMLQLVQALATPAVPPDTQPSADLVAAGQHPEDLRYDPAVRAALRRQQGARLPKFQYGGILAAQIGYLDPNQSEAAFDSELANLWITFYPRSRFELNAWNYRLAGNGGIAPMLVSRLDAPEPNIVRAIIASSIRAEQNGLHGKVVIDSRGLHQAANSPTDEYATYDQSLRDLAALIKNKTTLELTLDENPDVLPPHSASDVAIYCGWYSVGKYVPSCSFVPGAVGYHIASYEMISLRDPANTGWVRGLLKDGVSATMGSVAEPMLMAFPKPDDFFPLLLTGRLTLAEVYWRTELTTSWQMSLIGDPLYCPFKNNPALSVSDLPDRLKPVIASTLAATSEPTTRP